MLGGNRHFSPKLWQTTKRHFMQKDTFHFCFPLLPSHSQLVLNPPEMPQDLGSDFLNQFHHAFYYYFGRGRFWTWQRIQEWGGCKANRRLRTAKHYTPDSNSAVWGPEMGLMEASVQRRPSLIPSSERTPSFKKGRSKITSGAPQRPPMR